MVKVVTFFLIAILVLGMFGKLGLLLPKNTRKMRAARKCKSCGSYLIGKAPCQCGAKRR